MTDKQNSTTIDFGSLDLKALILTNDPAEVERIKAKGEVGVWFGPDVAKHSGLNISSDIYVIGILKDTVESHPCPRLD